MLNVLLFITTYVGGFLGGIFRNPAYAFVLYEVVYFFYPQQRWWGHMVPDISYSFYVVILMMFLVVINFNTIKENKLLDSPPIRWMYLFAALFCLAYFYAVVPELHYEASIFFTKLIIIVSIAYKLCSNREQLNQIVWGYMFGAWYVSFVAFQVGRNSGDRVVGIGTVDSPDSNDISAALAPAIVLCLYYFWISKNWALKALFALGGIFIANGLVLINSRGAFLAAVAGILYFMGYMFFSKFQRKNQRTMAVFIIIAGLSGGLFLADDSFIERLKSMQNTEVDVTKQTGATRTEFWKAAWVMTKDHPFGSGFKGFNFYAPDYLPEDLNTGGSRHRTVHSAWFEALTEAGYLGLIVFILMLYSAFRVLNICKKQLAIDGEIDEYFKMIALQSAILSFMVSMTFLNRMRAEVLYWLIIYSACAYNIYILKRPQKKPKPIL